MPLIKKASWSDLGYSKVGPTDPNNNNELERTRLLGEIIKNFKIHEVIPTGAIHTGNEVWIRDPARKKGNSPDYLLKKCAIFDKDNFQKDNLYNFVDKYKSSGYAKKAQSGIESNWEELQKMVRHIVDDPLKFKAAYMYSCATLMCDTDLLKYFLKDYAFKAFFEAHPNGKILIYIKDYNYEKRYASMRGAYTLTQYPLSELKASGVTGFPSMQRWQHLDTVHQPILIAELCAFSFYPIVPFFISGPVGFLIFYLFDEVEKHELKPFPESWLHYMRRNWDFGKQSHTLYEPLINPGSPESQRVAHGRLINEKSFKPDEMIKFIDWIIEKYNKLAFHLSDPAEHYDKNTYIIDFILAQEYALTIDRVFRKALSCITSEEHIVRTEAAMEIADLLESLRKVWSQFNIGEWFKILFNPIEGKKLVLSSLKDMPEPFKSHFSNITNKVYDDLSTIVKNSIWLKSKITPNGVYVKDKAMKNEKEKLLSDFVSNVIRALRNTHHGYFTSLDPQSRPSRYLALVDGNIPVSISYLGVLWALALLGNPKEMIEWDWMPTRQWD